MKLYKFRASVAYLIARQIAKLFMLDIPPLPSGCAIIVNAGKILVNNLSYEDGYALPGGGLKEGENFVDCMKREVFEETGLTVVDYKYFGTFSGKLKWRYSTNVVYTVKVSGKLRSSSEGNAVWVGIDEAIKKSVYEDCTKALKLYKKLNEKR